MRDIPMNDLKLIETYKGFVQKYSLEQLNDIPEQGVWSIGQMYNHLICVAHEYLDSAEACATGKGELRHGIFTCRPDYLLCHDLDSLICFSHSV